jgi:hypothetical protein
MHNEQMFSVKVLYLSHITEAAESGFFLHPSTLQTDVTNSIICEVHVQ